ncbi:MULTISPECIES: helix-turn-helix domain-containing protein [Micromonospora]|nr:helix-turn-helix transcriptional regulator [Micromonospora yangpuensis]
MSLLRRVIGDVLRRIRRQQGRTIREVASVAGVSLPYLSEVERGRKEASSEVLAAICRALGIDLAELLEEARDELRRGQPPVPATPGVRPPAPLNPGVRPRVPASRRDTAALVGPRRPEPLARLGAPDEPPHRLRPLRRVPGPRTTLMLARRSAGAGRRRLPRA